MRIRFCSAPPRTNEQASAKLENVLECSNSMMHLWRNPSNNFAESGHKIPVYDSECKGQSIKGLFFFVLFLLTCGKKVTMGWNEKLRTKMWKGAIPEIRIIFAQYTNSIFATAAPATKEHWTLEYARAESLTRLNAKLETDEKNEMNVLIIEIWPLGIANHSSYATEKIFVPLAFAIWVA